MKHGSVYLVGRQFGQLRVEFNFPLGPGCSSRGAAHSLIPLHHNPGGQFLHPQCPSKLGTFHGSLLIDTAAFLYLVFQALRSLPLERLRGFWFRKKEKLQLPSDLHWD